MAIWNQTSATNFWKWSGCMVSTSSKKKPIDSPTESITNNLPVSVLLTSHHSHSVFSASFAVFSNFQLYKCLGRLLLTLALHLQPSMSLILADYIAALVPRNSPPNHWLQKWQPYWLADRFPMMYPYTQVGCVNDMSVSQGNSAKRCLSW